MQFARETHAAIADGTVTLTFRDNRAPRWVSRTASSSTACDGG
jgi:hypothetical protein